MRSGFLKVSIIGATGYSGLELIRLLESHSKVEIFSLHSYSNYSENVALGTHNLLLRPRENHELRLELFTLNITPKAKVLWHLDVEDNSNSFWQYSFKYCILLFSFIFLLL